MLFHSQFYLYPFLLRHTDGKLLLVLLHFCRLIKDAKDSDDIEVVFGGEVKYEANHNVCWHNFHSFWIVIMSSFIQCVVQPWASLSIQRSCSHTIRSKYVHKRIHRQMDYFKAVSWPHLLQPLLYQDPLGPLLTICVYKDGKLLSAWICCFSCCWDSVQSIFLWREIYIERYFEEFLSAEVYPHQALNMRLYKFLLLTMSLIFQKKITTDAIKKCVHPNTKAYTAGEESPYIAPRSPSAISLYCTSRDTVRDAVDIIATQVGTAPDWRNYLYFESECINPMFALPLIPRLLFP